MEAWLVLLLFVVVIAYIAKESKRKGDEAKSWWDRLKK